MGQPINTDGGGGRRRSKSSKSPATATSRQRTDSRHELHQKPGPEKHPEAHARKCGSKGTAGYCSTSYVATYPDRRDERQQQHATEIGGIEKKYEHRGALRGTPGSAYPQPEPNATELPSSVATGCGEAIVTAFGPCTCEYMDFGAGCWLLRKIRLVHTLP